MIDRGRQIVVLISSELRRRWAALPQGKSLPPDVWHRRHRFVTLLLWVHAIGLAGFTFLLDQSVVHSLLDGGVIAVTALLAAVGAFGRRLRSAVASLGLVTASAVLVHLSGGYIEMHFYFFVMVALMALYQDWTPFLLAIGFVALHHGAVGVLDPASVYNHPAAWARPWTWAGIHAVFVLAASGVSLVAWRLNETMQGRLHESHAALERQAGQMKVLAHLARTLSETLDFDVVGQRITESIRSLLSLNRASLYRLDPQTGDLTAVARTALDANALARRLDHVPAGMGVVGRAVDDRAPASTADILHDPRIRVTALQRQRVSATDNGAVLAVPLIVQDRVIGALSLGDRTGRVFGEEEIRLAQTFADQAAVAIENAQLFATSERQRRAAEALAEVGQALVGSLEPAVVSQVILENIRTLLRAHSPVLYQVDPHSGDLVALEVSTELVPSLGRGLVLAHGTGVAGRAVAEQQPVTTTNILEDSRIALTPEVRARIERAPYRAVLSVPLVVRGEVIGALSVGDSAGRVFDDEDVRLAQAFADKAAIALENARLYRRAEERAERLRALSELMRLITAAAEDRRELYDAVARAATMLLGARLTRVWVSDPGASLLRTEGIFSDNPAHATEAARSETISDGYGAIAEVFLTREPQYFADVQRDPRFLKPAWAGNTGLHAAALVPLVTDTGVVGVLSIFFGARPPFTDEEQDLMRLLADQAATVIAKSRLYDEAGRSLAALEEKNAELDSFVYSVSHDLKAPLVAIQGMAGALVEDFGGQLDQQGRHYLARLQANVEHMERLIQDLLALSRIGRESRPAEAVNLAEVVDDVISELAEPIRARGIKVVVRAATTIWGIRRQVEQVMANLLGNAVKYIGDTESPMVEVGTIDRAELVECYVRDNGIGIDAAYHEKVFEIFQRLHEIETEGTGVGLGIVKKVVEGAGGRVWVESMKGQGATFRFTWPARSGRETWNGQKR